MARKILRYFLKVILAAILSSNMAQAESTNKLNDKNSYIKVTKGHSYPLRLNYDIDTLAIGDPNIIQVATLKPNMIMISGQSAGSTSLTVFGTDNQQVTYVVNVANDTTVLISLISQIEPNVSVENLGEVIVLKGTVKTAAALSRVLTIADRFVSNAKEPNFSVISDKGGILAGNLDESEDVDPVQLRLSLQTLAMGGRGSMGGGSMGGGNMGGGGLGAGGMRGGGGAAASLRQPLYPNKGNLAQNISRGDVITVANGKVMSLIKVESQPKVEIQMQIIAVDRNKTDELGWDWRLTSIIENGSSTTGVSFGSLLGGVNSSIGSGIASPTNTTNNSSNNSNATNIGSSTIAGVLSYANPAQGITLGLVNFLKLIEEKGAGTTLSEPLVTSLSGESASFLVGGSLPIPVQAISAGSATQNAVVATNVRFVQYGLSLIVRPTVLENGKISIVLDQSISEPDYTNAFTLLGAPIPAFKQKTVSTLTESASGETWAVAGLLTEEDTKRLSEVPYFAQIPILGNLFKKKSNKTTRNELFIVVNARRIDGTNQTSQNFNNSGNLKPTDDIPTQNESSNNDHEVSSSDEKALVNEKKPASGNTKPSKSTTVKKQNLSSKTQKLPIVLNGLPKKELQQHTVTNNLSANINNLSTDIKSPPTEKIEHASISNAPAKPYANNKSGIQSAQRLLSPANTENISNTEPEQFNYESELLLDITDISSPELQFKNNSSLKQLSPYAGLIQN